jgi:26S proteasome regulatory subunit T6
MALDEYYHNKIEAMKLEILKGQAALRRLEAQRNDYNSRVRLLREELGLLQQPGSYVGEVVKVMSTKKILVKVHPEGKYGMITRRIFFKYGSLIVHQLSTCLIALISANLPPESESPYYPIATSSRRCSHLPSIPSSLS